MLRYLALLTFIPVWAQPPTSLVQDTLYMITSTGFVPVQLGTLVISWPSFTYCGSSAFTIPAGGFTYTVNNGVVRLSLVPTDLAASTVAYSVAYAAGPGVPTTRSYWQIPTNGGPFTIASVTNTRYVPPIASSRGVCSVVGSTVSWTHMLNSQWTTMTN
jgi:hypothetical protein